MPSEVAARKWVWKERFQFLFWKTSTLGECRVCSGGWGNLSCVCFLTRREVDDLAYPGCVREFEKRWRQGEKSSNAIGEKKKKKWSCCTGDTHFCTFLSVLSVLVKTTTWIVIYLTFHSTKRALWLVGSWSRAPDQIQMHPDQDTIPQLLPAPDVLLRLLTEKSKYTTKHLMSGSSGN